MAKKIGASDPGTTEVAVAAPANFGDVFRVWVSIPQWAIASGCATSNPNLIGLWIANEFIDWEHYRANKEYRPVGANALRLPVIDTVRG